MSEVQHPTGGLTITCPACGWAGPWNLPYCPECQAVIPENVPAGARVYPAVIVDAAAVQTIDEVNRRGED